MNTVWGVFALVTRLHRSSLILATILLAIAAARTAVSPTLGTWLILVGAAILMYLSDLLREIEENAAELARSTKLDRSRTRRDIFAAHRPILIGVAVFAGCGLVVAGFVAGA